MSLIRVYQPLHMDPCEHITLDQKASHHLAHVLRVKVGDKIRLFNGDVAGDFEAIITEINKKNIHVQVLSFLEQQTESPVQICLAQGIARGEKMDFIVQKAVELGVTQIVPLITERCNVRLDEKRVESRASRWHAISVNACEQSGRTRLPQISQPLSLVDWLPTIEAEKCYVLSPHCHEKFKAVTKSKSLALLIGPEGGLTEQEIDLASRRGFEAINLGPRILRAETATIAAITLFQFFDGDM